MNFNGKKEIKIALVMDDYKLKNKEDHWARALKKIPEIEAKYVFDREVIGEGVTVDTVTVFRYFKLKEADI